MAGQSGEILDFAALMSGSARLPNEPLVWPAEAASSARATAPPRMLAALFATTLFTSACLMFIVEPMVARLVLPMLGGAPAVWNTCLVFFQVMLLAGYAYAHAATQYFGVRRHVLVHGVVILLPLLVLPVGLRHAAPDPSQSPIGWLLLVLTASIGLPFFVLSTSAAVLQKWFSATDDESAADPYFLYTASNLGSFIALLAYPVFIEPTLTLRDQSRLWSYGYAAFGALTLVCAAVVWRRAAPASDMGERTVPAVANGRIDRLAAPRPLDRAGVRALQPAACRHELRLDRRRLGSVVVDRAARALPALVRDRVQPQSAVGAGAGFPPDAAVRPRADVDPDLRHHEPALGDHSRCIWSCSS